MNYECLVWVGMSSTGFCPIIESEDVVGLRAADGIRGRREEGACMVY